MKIYQVEELVGITKKNIRFYEDEGLLTPERNPENGYREYTQKDVRCLQKIKLLRKLSVPIEEIRRLEKGECDFSGVMSAQIEKLEKEAEQAEIMKNFCLRLNSEVSDIKNLDASAYLDEMRTLEKGGSVFVDITKEDVNRRKKTGAVISAVVFCTLMLALLACVIFAVQQEEKALFPMLIVFAVILCAIVGTVIVLIQRIKEINGGEEYDACKY